MSNTSFFSFGPDDGFISKSHEGLRYRDLPPTLHQLIVSGSVVDIHWAALGSVRESWVLSFKDSEGKSNLGWGTDTPKRLQDILKSTAPSQHLRVTLGPKQSFLAWSPDFIRWRDLPEDLEDALQGWLTPFGWRDGPPKTVTWGKHSAYFALSEYGSVKWGAGAAGDSNTWPIFLETTEEWVSEPRFDWSTVAFIALDPLIMDQFFVIREDGTWAGSIEESNEDALQAFASNFFRKAKARTKTGGKSGQPTSSVSNPVDAIPDAAAQALYEKWATDVASGFASALTASSGKAKGPKKLEIRSQSHNSKPGIPLVVNGGANAKLLRTFPYLPPAITTCMLQSCAAPKADPFGLRACKHDVERLLRASGLYSFEWLRQERLRWHPDRFGRLCAEEWREAGKKLAEEMFKIVGSLINELKSP
ncbi:hypothetical protein EJ04DRAFT_363547 [Polyplosphaeria fusca]|uniref:Uncharacterized protein n=1 Tax=Polyplosphaeria fusca TaxID=682080 RepID=A0A9P4UX16_9PLEO|nr:hypothetical protein EJ04DRAFT_363547 [Polyplosphaeria fusca]